MRITSGQDIVTGLLFVATGLGALWIASDYPMGSAQRPGTGVLPYILSWCLVGTGLLLWVKTIIADGLDSTTWAWVGGLLLAGVGVVALWIGPPYLLQRAQPSGAEALRIFSAILVSIGLGVWVRAVFYNGSGLQNWAWRPVIMVPLATVAFALLVDRYGLVAAMLASMTLVAIGTPETRWGEYAVFTAIMLAIGIAIFIWGLGMPIQVLPKELTWR